MYIHTPPKNSVRFTYIQYYIPTLHKGKLKHRLMPEFYKRALVHMACRLQHTPNRAQSLFGCSGNFENCFVSCVQVPPRTLRAVHF